MEKYICKNCGSEWTEPSDKVECHICGKEMCPSCSLPIHLLKEECLTFDLSNSLTTKDFQAVHICTECYRKDLKYYSKIQEKYYSFVNTCVSLFNDNIAEANEDTMVLINMIKELYKKKGG